MLKWIGRGAAIVERLDRLEREGAATVAALKDAAAGARAAAGREADMMQALRDVSARLLAVEARGHADADAMRAARADIAALVSRTAPVDGIAALAADVAATREALDALRQGLDAERADIARLRAGVVWLEHRAVAQSEETRTGIAALLELIEIRQAGRSPA